MYTSLDIHVTHTHTGTHTQQHTHTHKVSLTPMQVCMYVYACMHVCVQLLAHYPHAHVFVHSSPPPWGPGDSEAAVRDIEAMYRDIIGPTHLRRVIISNLNPKHAKPQT